MGILVLFVLAAIPIVALDVYALGILIDGHDSDTELFTFLLLNAAASLPAGLLVHLVLPEGFRRPRVAVVALFASFAFFIPLLGVLAVLIGAALAAFIPRALAWHPFASLRPLEYSETSPETTAPRLRASGLNTMLLNPAAPTEVRVRSLVALQNLPGRVAGPVLRRLLTDPSDDVRLAAYSMLDAQWRRVGATIAAEREALDDAEDDETRVSALRRIAEQHWELVYGGLVDGDLRDHSIDEGLAALERALSIDSNEPGLWFLKGRFLQAERRFDDAEAAYDTAVRAGMLPARVLPFLAELAFARRDFDAVRRHVGAIASWHAAPQLGGVIRFWTRGNGRA